MGGRLTTALRGAPLLHRTAGGSCCEYMVQNPTFYYINPPRCSEAALQLPQRSGPMALVPDPTPASGLASRRPFTAMPGSLRGLLATSAARAAESRAAMLHACARRGSGTRLRLLPRAVLMGVGPNSTPSSAQVTAKPQSSCAIVASEALASPRPPPRVMKGQGWGLHAHPPWRSGTASWLLPRSV